MIKLARIINHRIPNKINELNLEGKNTDFAELYASLDIMNVRFWERQWVLDPLLVWIQLSYGRATIQSGLPSGIATESHFRKHCIVYRQTTSGIHIMDPSRWCCDAGQGLIGSHSKPIEHWTWKLTVEVGASQITCKKQIYLLLEDMPE